MLKTRVITAVLLLAGLLPALFYLPPLGWAWLTAAALAIGGWEWGGFMQLKPVGRLSLGAALFALCATVILSFPSAMGGEGWSEVVALNVGAWFYVPSVLFWALVLPFWLRSRWPLPGVLGGLAVGVLILLPTWMALVQLRQLGVWPLVSIMAVVWVADIAAYFSGRAFGKRKMAPSISPGKTWAGAVGAVLGVQLYGFLAAAWLPKALQPNVPVFAVVLAVLTALSIVGDLFESLLKRQAGIKDSSNVLPGHGGVLDRIDSLTSTLPFVALLWLHLH